MKICTKCKVEKPLTDFYKDKRLRLGVRSSCKSCQFLSIDKEKRQAWLKLNKEKKVIYQKLYRKVNKEKLSIQEKNYREVNKETRKVKREFYLKNNKEKVLLIYKKYRDNNKLKVSQTIRKYYLKNKEKFVFKSKLRAEKKKNNNFIKTELQKFVAQEMYHLAKIRKEQTGFDWHVDHIKPISKGGKHAINNLQVVPAIWNLSKGNRNNNIFKIGEI